MFKYAAKESDFFHSLEINLDNPYDFSGNKLSQVTDKISEASFLLENLGYLDQADQLVNFIEKLANKNYEIQQMTISDDEINQDQPVNNLSKNDQIVSKLNEMKRGLETIDDFDNNFSGLLQDLLDVTNAAIRVFGYGDYIRFQEIINGSKSAFDFVCDKGSVLDDTIVHDEILSVCGKYKELLNLVNGYNKEVN